MPHLSIEHSPSLEERADIGGLCEAMRLTLSGCGIFPTAGIRVRAYRADHAAVADGHPDNGFLAMTLSVGEGRSKGQLREVGDALFAAGREALSEPLAGGHFALSLEIRVIDAELSWKENPIHARLSGDT